MAYHQLNFNLKKADWMRAGQHNYLIDSILRRKYLVQTMILNIWICVSTWLYMCGQTCKQAHFNSYDPLLLIINYHSCYYHSDLKLFELHSLIPTVFIVLVSRYNNCRRLSHFYITCLKNSLKAKFGSRISEYFYEKNHKLCRH